MLQPTAAHLIVRPLGIVNSIIELHDSTVAEIVRSDDTVIVHFVPAYLHKSAGRPGRDAGSGWVQEARLIFADASVSGSVPDPPCDILDGEFIISDERHDNEIPVPVEIADSAQLHLIFGENQEVTVKGRSVRLELIGEPKYVEQFEP